MVYSFIDHKYDVKKFKILMGNFLDIYFKIKKKAITSTTFRSRNIETSWLFIPNFHHKMFKTSISKRGKCKATDMKIILILMQMKLTFTRKVCSQSRFESEGVFTWENSHRREFHTDMTFWFRLQYYRWHPAGWGNPLSRCSRSYSKDALRMAKFPVARRMHR